MIIPTQTPALNIAPIASQLLKDKASNKNNGIPFLIKRLFIIKFFSLL